MGWEAEGVGGGAGWCTISEAASGEKGMELELLRILYPTVAQAIGIKPLRAAVPNWTHLEHKLYAFFSWLPDGIPDDFKETGLNKGVSSAPGHSLDLASERYV